MLLRVAIAFVILLLLVVLAGVLTHRYLVRELEVSPVPEISPRASVEPKVTRIPPFEVFPKEEPAPPSVSSPSIKDKRPRVAIILDDVGYDKHIASKFLDLNTALTFAVLPHTPFTGSITKAIRSRGNELMLHLPMEPNEYPKINPGPGALLTSMTPDQLIHQLNANLDAVKGIKGVNNHMGSKMTANSNQLYQIFSELKRRNLYFVDSRSTAQTLGRPSARMFHLPFAERDVFIDHVQTPEFIRNQLKILVQRAFAQGEALGIMHPTRTTYETFRDQLPALQKDVHLVPVSEIVRVPS